MLHLGSTGVRESGFTKSKCLGVKRDEVYGLVLNTKSCLKIKVKSSSSSSGAGCSHDADGEESWKSGCAGSITLQGICPCPAQLVPGLLKASLPDSCKPGICFSMQSTFLLSLWIWSCRELGRHFSSVKIIAPCQDKNLGREQPRTLCCRGTGLVRTLPREVCPSLLCCLSPALALLHWQHKISSCCSSKVCSVKGIN